MGVAEHRLSHTLPEQLKGQLLTFEQLETELEGSLDEGTDEEVGST